MSAAIEVRGLGKQFRIGVKQRVKNGATIRDLVTDGVAGLLRRGRRTEENDAKNLFWALKDINLSISQGEVVGVIGKNGSGKSTFLKVLSDIVEPTEGRVVIRGRVASLLEVGTGFHNELTGRENIFLNGALLGMTQQEVRRNFDRIVDFSGVGKFLDTPVKRYSSGMYVRLAFAVAAHLDPEVLIVDEVLAVGDFAFQQKCLGRMKEVAQDGRTVLFVSHNMASVEMLCSRCVLLDGGHLMDDGDPYEITRAYRLRMSEMDNHILANLDNVEGAARKVRILSSVCLVDEAGALTSYIPISRAFNVRIGVRIPAGLRNISYVVRIESTFGVRMLTLCSPPNDTELNVPGAHEITCRVNEFPLTMGAYRIGLGVFQGREMIDQVNDALSFIVTEGEVFKEGRAPLAGMCVARSEWGIEGHLIAADSDAIPNSSLLEPTLDAPGEVEVAELEGSSSLCA